MPSPDIYSKNLPSRRYSAFCTIVRFTDTDSVEKKNRATKNDSIKYPAGGRNANTVAGKNID
jgi:hypothetical protein